MTDPAITCPQCGTEIKLTESLAAPLLEATRAQYEKRLSEKEAEITQREAAIKEQQSAVTKDREAIDEQVAEKLKVERTSIAAEESKKAKGLLGADLDQKNRNFPSCTRF